MAIELLYAQPKSHAQCQPSDIKGAMAADQQAANSADSPTPTDHNQSDQGSFADYRRQASKQANAEQTQSATQSAPDSQLREEQADIAAAGFGQQATYAAHQPSMAGMQVPLHYSAAFATSQADTVTGMPVQINGLPAGRPPAPTTPAQTPVQTLAGQAAAQQQTPGQSLSGNVTGLTADSATPASIAAPVALAKTASTPVQATGATMPGNGMLQGLTQETSLSTSVSAQPMSTLALSAMSGAESSPADWLMQRSAGELIRSAPQAQLLSPLTAADAQTQVDATQASRQAVTQWGPLPLTPNAQVPQHARELLQPLREQLRFQLDQHIQKAELRLDPPDMGKVDLNIRLDGDRLHIQMHAANNHIRDALQSGLERLRAELAQDHQGDIQLDVGQQGGDSDQRQARSHQEGQSISAMHHSESESGHQSEHPATSSDLNLLA